MARLFISQIQWLVLNVWREAARDRLIHLIVGSGVIMLLLIQILGKMAVGGRERVLQSTGFWILGVWGLLAVLYLGSNMVKNEIKHKTVYLILSRPVTRVTFMMGKYCGMLLVLGTAFAMLTLAWIFILYLNGIPFMVAHAYAVLFIFGEWMFLAALSLFFASFTSPLLHNFFLIGISFLGHWSNDLRILASNLESPGLKSLLLAIYYLLPNLEALNFREAAIYRQDIALQFILNSAGLLLGWILSALIAANIVFFNRKLI